MLPNVVFGAILPQPGYRRQLVVNGCQFLVVVLI
jgi:hypothetical protein